MQRNINRNRRGLTRASADMRRHGKHTIILVSMTHWDPEWYTTYEQYRIRLVRLVDKLLNILETNREYRHFMFDGQVSALEDYLEIHPENRDRICRLVRSGKLAVGPWWVMPELFMPSPESHIRNLLLGHKMGERLGGVMKIGYLADTPGYISQMPQILLGFGIDSMAGCRGIAGYENTDEDVFTWRSPDGSEILVISMWRGYGNAAGLRRGENPAAKARERRDVLVERATTPYLLFMEGTDHGEPVDRMPEIIEAANRGLDDDILIHGTLSDYVKRVCDARTSFKVHTGELCAENAQIFFTGNLAARIGIKMANRQSELLLEQWAEPFSAIAHALGEPYPRALLWRSWRYLLQNDFHDVIYGGHVDEVYEDAMNRYKASREISNWLAQEALHNIAKRVDTDGAGHFLVVFNPCAHRKDEVVEVEYHDNDFNVGEKRGRRPALLDENGQLVLFQQDRRELVTKHTTEKGVVERNMNETAMKYTFSLCADNVPALGYRTYSVAYLTPAQTRQRLPETDLEVSSCCCENRYLHLWINANGSLEVTDKLTGNTFSGLNTFEDSGDVGDLYHYYPPRRNRVITTKRARARVSLVRRGPAAAGYKIVLPLRLPKTTDRQSRSRTMATCRVTTFVSLNAGSRRVDIRTVVENRARNHRLRAVFPTGIESRFCHADSAFDVVRRPVGPPACIPPARPRYNPEGLNPQRLFLSLHEKGRGFTLINRGLPQYQIDPEGTVYLTLLRCEEYLLKRWIPFWGAPTDHEKWPVPGAQEIGTRTFEYSVYVHEGDWCSARSHAEALSFNASMKALQTGPHKGELPREMGFIEIPAADLVLSTVKQAEDGTGIVVRLYNLSDRTVRSHVHLGWEFRKVAAVNLLEDSEVQGVIQRHDGDRVHLCVGPHKIVTLKIIP